MGPADDPRVAVDPHGRVHGIRGLRVADTSILPAAPPRGPAATAVLIGELIAGAMRRDVS
jgi:choline dehydrogenase